MKIRLSEDWAQCLAELGKMDIEAIGINKPTEITRELASYFGHRYGYRFIRGGEGEKYIGFHPQHKKEDLRIMAEARMDGILAGLSLPRRLFFPRSTPFIKRPSRSSLPGD